MSFRTSEPGTPAYAAEQLKACENKEESKDRKEIDKEEAAEWKALGQYRTTQAAERKKQEAEEEAARKTLAKEETSVWVALGKHYADEAKERKKMEDEETNKREKAITKERTDEWNAINKFWEKSTKDFNSTVKSCEVSEGSTRMKLEKEQQGELDAIGKHKDKEGQTRKGVEDSEDKPRKDLEKEWTAATEAISKVYQARKALMDFLQISKKPAGEWSGEKLAPEKVTLISAEAKSDTTYYNIEVISGPSQSPMTIQARYSVFDSLKVALSGWGINIAAPFPGKASGVLGSMFKKMAAKAVDERKTQLNQWIMQAAAETRNAVDRRQEQLGSELSEATSRLTAAEDATEKMVKEGEEARNKRNEERRAWFAEQRERLEAYEVEAEEVRRKHRQLGDDREKARIQRKTEWAASAAADMAKWEEEQKGREAALEESLAQAKAAREEKKATEDAACRTAPVNPYKGAASAADAEKAKEAAQAKAEAAKAEEEAKAKAEAEQKKALEALQEKESAPAPSKARGKSVFEDD